MLYHKQLNMFQFLEDVSPLFQEAYSVLTTWRGVTVSHRLLNSVLSQTICLFSQYVYIVVPKFKNNDFPPSDVSGQQSLDLKR